LKSAACDISALENHDFSDRIALGRRDGGAARGLAGTIDPCGDACGRIECGKTHTLDLFRHATPVSAARFIAASR